MEFLADITDIRTIQWLACSGSCMLAFILLIIKIPRTEYSKRLATAKNTVAVSFLACGFLMLFSLSEQDVSDYEIFSSIVMLAAVSFSSMALSYSMMDLLSRRPMDGTKFIFNIFLGGISCTAMIYGFVEGYWTLYIIGLIVSLVLFVGQSIYYIVMFDRAYKSALKELEAYYDDDEGHKLRWIRFCYILAMLVDMFLLVYLLLPRSFMKWYIAWYVLYMLYFTGNFISFLGSHKLTLDAFAHNTLSGGDFLSVRNSRKRRKDSARVLNLKVEEEFKGLEASIRQWVADRKYREYDRSREDVAMELGTTKEILQQYFTLKVGQDFRSWRTALRVEDAKAMILKDKNLSVNYIGEICGFSDRSNFHRQFTKIVGCSPKKWRDTDGRPA